MLKFLPCYDCVLIKTCKTKIDIEKAKDEERKVSRLEVSDQDYFMLVFVFKSLFDSCIVLRHHVFDYIVSYQIDYKKLREIFFNKNS